MIGLFVFGGYGTIGLLMGSGAIVVAGLAYGGWLGLQVGSQLGPSLHPVLYAFGQAIWFVFSVVAPCGAMLFVGA